MKFRNKRAAAAMALLLTAGSLLPSGAVFAANQYTPINGTSTTFDKYLVMDKEAEIPKASFSFSAAPGSPRTYDVKGKKFEILAGRGTPVIAGVGTDQAGTVAFAPGDGSDAASAHSESDLVKNLDASVSKYAKKTVTVDFSKCTFTEPGVYRYVITESGTNQGVTNDPDLTRILDVYVIDDEGKLKVQAYVLHADEADVPMGSENGTADPETSVPKPQGFTNVYETSNLTFRKQVAGNQASHDKYFEFTLNITNAQPGTKLSVELSGADAVSGKNEATSKANRSKKNPSSLTVGEDGSIRQKFYLQHNQQITVQGIAKETAYTVTENPEDYKSAASTAAAPVVETAAGTIAADTQGVMGEKNLTTGYLNKREGLIPTGVVMSAAPFAAITLLGAAGAVTIVMKRGKQD